MLLLTHSQHSVSLSLSTASIHYSKQFGTFISYLQQLAYCQHGSSAWRSLHNGHRTHRRQTTTHPSLRRKIPSIDISPKRREAHLPLRLRPVFIRRKSAIHNATVKTLSPTNPPRRLYRLHPQPLSAEGRLYVSLIVRNRKTTLRRA